MKIYRQDHFFPTCFDEKETFTLFFLPKHKTVFDLNKVFTKAKPFDSCPVRGKRLEMFKKEKERGRERERERETKLFQVVM
jgi:hypothetical protein